MSQPPRLAVRLLTRRLHPDERDEVLGDLAEQFVKHDRDLGAWRAARWYWREALRLAWGFELHRRDVVSTDHERTRGWWALANLRLDVRHAWRSLRHSPALASVAIATLTVSIGLSTAVFSLVDGILLEPLPYPESDRLVRLAEVLETGPTLSRLTMSATRRVGSLVDTTIGVWRPMDGALDAFVPYSTSMQTAHLSDGADQVFTAEVGAQFFDLFSIRPLDGRLFTATDESPDAPKVAVISQRFWSESLGRRADAVGASITFDSDALTIVGIVPDSLTLPEPGVQVWRPGQWRWPAPGGRRMFRLSLQVLGRLRAGASLADAQREGDQVVRAIAQADPAFADGTVAIPRVVATRLVDDITAPVRAALTALFAGMALVFTAACVSLANLLLARNSSRDREIAVRLALGASRRRLAQPLVIEQLAIALSGGLGGGLLAWWILRALPAIAPVDLPRLNDVAFNVTSLAFATAAAALTVVIVGLFPVWRLPKSSLRDLSAPGRVRVGHATTSADAVRSALVVGQVALAAVLLVGAALVSRSFMALLRVDPGYQPAGVLTFQVGLPDLLSREKGRQTAFFDDVTARLRRDPRVRAVGIASTLPLLGTSGLGGTFLIEGRPAPPPGAERPQAHKVTVTPDYFRAIGARVVRGRIFTAADTLANPLVIVVDEALAESYFPGEEVIGQRITGMGRDPRTVVGVVASVRLGPMSRAGEPTIFHPAAQVPETIAFNRFTGGFAVRVDGDPLDLVPAARNALRDSSGGWPMFHARRLDDRLGETFSQPRFYSVVLLLFAALGLSTAVLGLYGVISYAVERRHVEFGVRRALGASERHLLGLVLGRGLGLAGAGLTLGLAGAAATAGFLRSILFGVQPLDVPTFAGVAVLVLGVVLAASWRPARRAIAIDPLQALRVD